MPDEILKYIEDNNIDVSNIWSAKIIKTYKIKINL
jgi:hypothetical protein